MFFLQSVSKMLVILFAIACGYLANRLGIMGGEVDQKFTKLILTITLPAMTVGAVATGSELPEASVVLDTLRVAAVFYGMEFVFAFIVPRLLGGTPGQRGVWRFTLAFPNLAFIGYPVVVAFFGPEALFYAVILTLPFNLLAFTLGPLMLAGAKRFSLRQMFSPCVIASIAALVLTLTRLRPPAVVGEALELVGDASVPLSLLCVGSLLAGLPLGRMLASIRLWILSAFRLLVMPMALFAILRGLGTAPLILGIAVAEMGMPVAVNGSLLCMEYGGDAESMAQITFVSTLLAMVTLPLLATLFLL